MTPAEVEAWGRGVTRRLTSSDVPELVLARVRERDGGGGCVACRRRGLQTPSSEPIEVDHLQPLARGGDWHWTNLRLLCRWHNRGRAARAKLPESPPWARGPGASPQR